MVDRSMEDLPTASEPDLLLTRSKSFADDNEYSWSDLTGTYFDNSKQLNSSTSDSPLANYYKNLPGAVPVSVHQIRAAQNTNAPWLVNILRKRFHRSRKPNDHAISGQWAALKVRPAALPSRRSPAR